MIGKTISHYKIIDQLGSGGMGVVDKAQHLKLDRNVAIKFIPLSLSLDEEAKKRFIHEAKTAYSLDHPNIFIIHEIDEMEDKHLFIVLAYCEGEILEQMISKGSFQLYVSVNYTKQVAEALNLIEKTKGTGFNCDYGTLYKVLLNDPFCK